MKLSRQKVAEYMEHHTKEDQIRFWLYNQCAPVLDCDKPSFLSCLTKCDIPCYVQMAVEHQLNYARLYQVRGREVLFFYDPNRLKGLLERQDVLEFLLEKEYTEVSILKVMQRMTERMEGYYAGVMQYPHEIGVLLGYPVWDVRDFIKYQGQNYLLSGYWKVYHNVEEAKARFEAYDQSRYQALCKIIKTQHGKD